MKKKSKLLALLILSVILLAECLILFRENAEAEPAFPCPGYITASPSCYMRQDAGTGNEALRELRKDTRVQVVAAVQGQSVDGNTTWYEIQYNNMTGYVSSAFVRLGGEIPSPVQMPAPDEQSFVASLVSEGFPVDYQEKLLALHRQHPLWRFRALHTNYGFDTAVQGEYRPGVNLVPATSPAEFKSMADTDFSYINNSWREYEAGWVGASRELIAFQMDPRNFLDETQVFQFENLQFISGMDYRRGLAAILQGSFMDGEGPIVFNDFRGQKQQIEGSYRELLIRSGENAGVSPYHLASRIRQEVSPNGSGSVSGNYRDLPGLYNFYNIGATGGSDPVYSGLITARDGIQGNSAAANEKLLFPWTDPVRAVAGGAIFLSQDYISVDQQTLYLQKWNLVSRFTRPFTHQYMGNVLAPEYEAIDVFKAYQEMGALDEAKEFIIPVFANMPDMTVAPTDGGNPNNWLRGIAVNGELVANFIPTRFEYRVQISSATKEVAVQAAAWNPYAYISGVGLYQLKAGNNEIVLQVQAPNGGVRNYRLLIQQGANLAPPEAQGGEPKLKSGSYQMNALGYIFGADPNLGSNQKQVILANFSPGNGFVTDLVDANGQAVQAAVGTGASVIVREGAKVVNQFPLVILGDVNGDGSIDVVDANLLYGYVSGQTGVPGTAYGLAMDVNQDGFSDIVDANLIYAHVSGLQLIEQKLKK